MATSGYNEGIGVLAEFVCTAIPVARGDDKQRNGRGNETESVDRSVEAGVTDVRIAELGALRTHELLTLLKREGPRLSRAEWGVIRDIAVSRINGCGEAELGDLAELLREAIRAVGQSEQ